MKKSINLILLLIIIFGFFSCNNNSHEKTTTDIFTTIKPEKRLLNFFGKDKNGFRYGEQDVITKSKKTHKINWLIYNLNSDGATISIPERWVYDHQNDVFAYFQLDTINSDFFIWKKYKKSEYDINLETFAKYFYDVIITDSIEVCKEPIVKKYSYENNIIGFYIKCNMSKNNAHNISHSFLTHDKKYLHEFSLKHTEGKDNDLNEILFHLTIDGVFYNKEKVITEISPSKIDISVGLK